MKKIIAILVVLILVLTPGLALADIAVGDVIVSLGENLTDSQKQAILEEFNAPEDALQITTSNQEEHKYLGGVIPAAQIGSRALSSVMVTYTQKGSGIKVSTNNINYITEQTYTNSLITAGINDADIQITAPFEVSGTAALTGIMKAYEVSTGEAIDEDVKKVANEEMVTSAELGEEIGDENATDIINEIKKQIAEQNPQTTEDVKNIVINVVNNFNINLSQEQIDKLVSLFDKMKDLNINWNQVANQIENLSGKATEFLSSDEGASFLSGVRDFFSGLANWIRSLF
ncbi:DUF1002 domain-containing protein [Alkalibaculum sp. M08DMB]|uniref:DUF1002 domain-containing protein n=1 Tax=Alkalibaculum sporogenes TaxID=2655001 RepID=A0A6A7KCZ0_9FIRM|nr:DUF1002 domain-containing protein [Alkalibaculum sporogenes]MPW26863.1 DUF1002 domain-containing protein [Alkalibaculum sporogenes]